MKPPKVPKSLWEGRQPLGAIISGLPSLYLAHREDGTWMLMRDNSKGESTGPQVCLATITPDVMAILLGKSSAPLSLGIVDSGAG